MAEKAKRGRPPTGEAKEAVTLRLRPVVVRAYKAKGDDWRERMEKAIVEALAPKLAARTVMAKTAAAASTVSVAVPLHQPKAFNPQPKPGKPR